MQRAEGVPHAAIVHPSEALTDLVQYELERAGISTTTVVLGLQAGAETVAPFLLPAPDVCVVGISTPYLQRSHLLAQLRQSLLRTRLVVLTPAPWIVDQWVGDLVAACVAEVPDLEQNVDATVQAVRRTIGPMLPIRDAGFAIRRAHAAMGAALLARERSLRLRTEARSVRLQVSGSRAAEIRVGLQGSPA